MLFHDAFAWLFEALVLVFLLCLNDSPQWLYFPCCLFSKDANAVDTFILPLFFSTTPVY
jgi:hypothetical protein